MLSKTAELVRDVDAQLDVYDLAGACASVRLYLEGLTNWYIRRSRQRFWDGDADAIDTLHTVLEVVCRVVAPLLPLTTEVIWRGLTGERSVHLTDWPAADELVRGRRAGRRHGRDPGDRVGRAVRAQGRVPAGPAAAGIADGGHPERGSVAALRVAAVRRGQCACRSSSPSWPTTTHRVSRQLSVNARAAGPRLGQDVQKVIKASKSGDWTVADDGECVCGGIALVEGEYTLELVATGSSSDAVGLLRSGGFVSLDTVLDDELVAEGAVNDLLRLAQQARKDAGLQVSDRIDLTLEVETICGRQCRPGSRRSRPRRSRSRCSEGSVRGRRPAVQVARAGRRRLSAERVENADSVEPTESAGPCRDRVQSGRCCDSLAGES